MSQLLLGYLNTGPSTSLKNVLFVYAYVLCVTFIRPNLKVSPGRNMLKLLTYKQYFVHT